MKYGRIERGEFLLLHLTFEFIVQETTLHLLLLLLLGPSKTGSIKHLSGM